MNPLSYNESIKLFHTITNLDFSNIDEIVDDYNTNPSEQFDLYQVKYDFALPLENEFYPHNKTEFEYNISIFDNKRFSLNWIKYFSDKCYKALISVT